LGNATGDPGRVGLLAINTYNNGFQYGVTNPNSLSDGDDKGKGELNGSIGSKTDIYGNATGDPGRVGLLAINTYNNGFQYGVNNPNALSDGDDKGRGENASGQIGTKTDILGNSIGPGRNDLLLKNKYDLSKTYPDF
jgi:ssDNA-binding replication factor A large subunit